MQTDYPLRLLCEIFAVSRRDYHAWASGRRDVRERRDAELRPQLRAAFAASGQTYGYPRLIVELRAQHEPVGQKRVARLLREAELCSRPPRRRYRPRTTDSDHDGPIAPNRLAERAAPIACDQVWQTDITYLPTAAGWLYRAVVLDAYSKRVLGWSFSASLETDFVLGALAMAIHRRGGRYAQGLLLHSDRGVRYASARFRAQLAAHGITASMSRRGNGYDNARAKSFFSTLKLEPTYHHRFVDRAQAQRETFAWIEGFYNLRRRHSSIDYLSPIDFENQTN